MCRAAAGGGYVKRHRRRGYQGSKLPFVEEAGFTVPFPAGLKYHRQFSGISANLIIENYITSNQPRVNRRANLAVSHL
jgi:hypothetical protein